MKFIIIQINNILVKTLLFLKELKKDTYIKINCIILIFLLFLKAWVLLFNVFVNEIDTIDFLCSRFLFILFIIIGLKILSNLSFVQEFRQEMDIFNEGPVDKSFFIYHLRKYHMSLFISSFFCYILATTYFVEDLFLSYLLGLIAFINLILYCVQSFIYTKAYLKRSFKDTSSICKNNKVQIKTMFTSTSMKKVSMVCLEFAKIGFCAAVGAESLYKLTHAGMNDISPIRQQWLNEQFPEDKTKVWTETKAIMSAHKRAMSQPHNPIYDTETIIKEFHKKN